MVPTEVELLGHYKVTFERRMMGLQILFAVLLGTLENKAWSKRQILHLLRKMNTSCLAFQQQTSWLAEVACNEGLLARSTAQMVAVQGDKYKSFAIEI